ncbi:MAG: hypothetical protein N2690_08390 [Rhodocyclaceae bacterium]|nr:hypothetical protein [Rhodocyclaceae bacterium]
MRRALFALVGLSLAFAWLARLLYLDRAGSVVGEEAVFVLALAIGLPALYLCCRRRWWACWQMMALGAGLGFAVALPFASGPYAFAFLLLVFVLAGAALGLAFWCAAVWRNEDLTCPKYVCLPCGTVYRVARNALSRHRLQSK